MTRDKTSVVDSPTRIVMAREESKSNTSVDEDKR